MTEPRKLPVVAIVLASAALVVALVAVGVLVTRGDPVPAAAAEQPADPDHGAAKRPAIVDITVDAEIVKTLAESAVPRETRGTAAGFLVGDEKLRKALALEADDALLAFNGRELRRTNDLADAMLDAAMGRVSTIYVEVDRGNEQVLVRWRPTGDLRRAYFGSAPPSARIAPLPAPDPVDPFSSPRPVAPDPVVPDPTNALIDRIVKLDDTHVNVPEAVVDAMLANPMTVAKGARIVPSIKNGAPNGFKLYAIRPNSLYARLGFANGDTLKSVNGHALTSADKALEIYTKLRTTKRLVFEIDRRGQPVTLEISIVK